MEQHVNDKISSILVEHNEKYSEENRKINRLRKAIEGYRHYMDDLQNLCKSIEKKYLELGITISNENEVMNYKENIERDTEVLKECVEKELIEIKKIRNKLDEISNSVIDYNLKILDIKEKNSKIKKEPLYMSVEQFFEKRTKQRWWKPREIINRN